MPRTQTIYAGSIPSEETFGEARVVQIRGLTTDERVGGFMPSLVQKLRGVPSDELVGSLMSTSSATGTLAVSSELRTSWNEETTTLLERLLDERLELVSWYLRQRQLPTQPLTHWSQRRSVRSW